MSSNARLPTPLPRQSNTHGRQSERLVDGPSLQDLTQIQLDIDVACSERARVPRGSTPQNPTRRPTITTFSQFPRFGPRPPNTSTTSSSHITLTHITNKSHWCPKTRPAWRRWDRLLRQLGHCLAIRGRPSDKGLPQDWTHRRTGNSTSRHVDSAKPSMMGSRTPPLRPHSYGGDIRILRRTWRNTRCCSHPITTTRGPTPRCKPCWGR